MLFDLVDRYPTLGSHLKVLMRDPESAADVIEWIEGYLSGLCDAGVINLREQAECQVGISMSIGITQKRVLKLVSNPAKTEN